MAPVARIYGGQAELAAHDMEGRGWKSPLLANPEFSVLSTVSEGPGWVGGFRMGCRNLVVAPVPPLHLG